METLNALLNKPIATLDGIIYMPQVIRTDNTKGEMVVEIKIKKGAVIETVNFTIVGFIKVTKAQTNVEEALAKVVSNTISGDANKLPSTSNTKSSIKALTGFPSSSVNGILFSAITKSHNDIKGELVIILTATKGSISENKEIIISGFQTQAQADQNIVETTLEKINNATISGDANKLPSTSNTKSSIKALTGFPSSSVNGVFFSAITESHNDIKGELVIILTATKRSVSKDKVITISGFQTQAQADQNIVETTLEKINNATISGYANKLPSTSNTKSSIKALTGFPSSSVNGVFFSAITESHNDIKGELVIILTATKGSISENKEITISGFQTQVQSDQVAVDAYKELIVRQTKMVTDKNKALASKVSYNNFSEFSNQKYYAPFNIPPKDITIQFSVVNDDVKGEQDVTLTITKGDAITTHSIKIIGFKLSSRTRTKEQAKSLNEQRDVEYSTSFFHSEDGYITIEKNKLSSEVKYNNLEDFNTKTNASFSKRFSRHNIAINVINKNGWQIVHFTVTYNDSITTKTIIVIGFKKQI